MWITALSKTPALWLAGFAIFVVFLLFLFVALWGWSQKTFPKELQRLRRQNLYQEKYIQRLEQNAIADEMEIDRLRRLTTEH